MFRLLLLGALLSFCLAKPGEEAEQELQLREDETLTEDEAGVLAQGEEVVEEEVVEVKKRKYKPDPYPEGGTDPVVHNAEPVVINARKFARLVKQNEAVATCRYILFKIWKKYHDAQAHCNNLQWPFTHRGIGLATVGTESENHDITQLLKEAYGLRRHGKPYDRRNWAWIGLSKRKNNDRKLTKKEKGKMIEGEWFWHDNTTVTFQKWARKMPDQQYNKKLKEYQTFVMINKRGHWDDTYQYMEAPFVCEYCGRYIVFEHPLTWDQAKEECAELGLTMAVIDSENDNLEFGWAVNITFGSQGTSGKRFNATNWIWIGEVEVMDEAGKGTGVWTHHDGSKINWEPHWDRKYQPDNWTLPKLGEESVAAYSRLDAKWDDSFHKGRKRPFACMCPHTCTFPYDHATMNGGTGKKTAE